MIAPEKTGYRFLTRQNYPVGSTGWFAFFPTLGEYTVYGMGDTEEEAVNNMMDAYTGIVSFWERTAHPIPPRDFTPPEPIEFIPCDENPVPRPTSG